MWHFGLILKRISHVWNIAWKQRFNVLIYESTTVTTWVNSCRLTHLHQIIKSLKCTVCKGKQKQHAVTSGPCEWFCWISSACNFLCKYRLMGKIQFLSLTTDCARNGPAKEQLQHVIGHPNWLQKISNVSWNLPKIFVSVPEYEID